VQNQFAFARVQPGVVDMRFDVPAVFGKLADAAGVVRNPGDIADRILGNEFELAGEAELQDRVPLQRRGDAGMA